MQCWYWWLDLGYQNFHTSRVSYYLPSGVVLLYHAFTYTLVSSFRIPISRPNLCRLVEGAHRNHVLLPRSMGIESCDTIKYKIWMWTLFVVLFLRSIDVVVGLFLFFECMDGWGIRSLIYYFKYFNKYLSNSTIFTFIFVFM